MYVFNAEVAWIITCQFTVCSIFSICKTTYFWGIVIMYACTLPTLEINYPNYVIFYANGILVEIQMCPPQIYTVLEKATLPVKKKAKWDNIPRITHKLKNIFPKEL